MLKPGPLVARRAPAAAPAGFCCSGVRPGHGCCCPAAKEQLWELQRRSDAEHRFAQMEEGRRSAPVNLRWGKSRVCCLIQSPAPQSFPHAPASLVHKKHLFSCTQAPSCPKTHGAGRSKHGTAAPSETRVFCWHGKQKVAIHPPHPNLRLCPASPGFGGTGCRETCSGVHPQDLTSQHGDPIT